MINFPPGVQKLFDDFGEVSNSIGDHAIVIGGYIRDVLFYGTSDGDIDVVLQKGQNFQFSNALSLKYGSGQPNLYKNTQTIHMILDGFDVEVQADRNPLVHFNIDDVLLEKGKELTWINRNVFERDFTINTIFYDVKSKKIHDLTGGRADLLENKILRCPIPAERAIHNNPLIIARAAKFSIEFGLKIEDDFMRVAPNFQNEFLQKIQQRENSQYIKSYLGQTFDMDFDKAYEYYKSINFLDIIPVGEDLQSEIQKRNIGITVQKRSSRIDKMEPIRIKKYSDRILMNCFPSEYSSNHLKAIQILHSKGEVNADTEVQMMGGELKTVGNLMNPMEKTSMEISKHLYDSLQSRHEYRQRKRKENKKKVQTNYQLWQKMKHMIDKYKGAGNDGKKDDSK